MDRSVCYVFCILSVDIRNTNQLSWAMNYELCGQVGPLDQGYWPDGLLTPPSEDAMRQLLTLLLLSFAEIKQNTGNIMSDLDDG